MVCAPVCVGLLLHILNHRLDNSGRGSGRLVGVTCVTLAGRSSARQGRRGRAPTCVRTRGEELFMVHTVVHQSVLALAKGIDDIVMRDVSCMRMRDHGALISPPFSIQFPGNSRANCRGLCPCARYGSIPTNKVGIGVQGQAS